MMPHPRMSSEEVGRRGREWYADHLRPVVETNENIGKLIVIDVETGDYEIDTDTNSLALTLRMRDKHTDPILYKMRIGYSAVYSFGSFRLMPSKR